MKIAILARRCACAAGALALIASLSATAAQGRAIQLFPKSQSHGHAARHKHKGKSPRKHDLRGPQGAPGPAGAQGPAGPAGPAGVQGPAGPGAIKFSYHGEPKANDPVHAVLPVGPFQLGVSCQPGKNPKDINFTLDATIPQALFYTQTLEFVSPSPPQGAPEITQGEEAATPTTPESTNVASGSSFGAWATVTLTVPATGTTTWLELWYGAKTESQDCYIAGIEV